jgi:LmbE family N-acetylglucosaminyl deacetylase
MDGDPLSALVVAAHPDDEILGAGIRLSRRPQGRVHILHVTDGSPQDMHEARALGIRTRQEYASIRRKELLEATGMLKIPAGNCLQFPLRDKEAYLNLPALVVYLELVIRTLQPALVLASAYEGGHPDHDAVAFAVSVVAKRTNSFEHWEFPLYHSGANGEMVTGRFIGDESDSDEVVIFSAEERALKRRLLVCFRTQAEILSNFTLERECFRRAPRYDFSEPPHAGPLLYERWGWGISGTVWREFAAEALTAVECFPGVGN